MRDNDILSLLKVSAGKSYKVTSEILDGNVEVLHRKCGNLMQLPVSQLALHGFSCNRCDGIVIRAFQQTAQECKSRELYNACINKLPVGFSIYGSTISEDDYITVSWPLGEDFKIKIADLINDVNLPDCLLHRDPLMHPSIQLSMLDMFIKDEKEILDDFETLDDTIRVKDNSTGTVNKATVREILKGLVARYDSYKIPNL